LSGRKTCGRAFEALVAHSIELSHVFQVIQKAPIRQKNGARLRLTSEEHHKRRLFAALRMIVVPLARKKHREIFDTVS